MVANHGGSVSRKVVKGHSFPFRCAPRHARGPRRRAAGHRRDRRGGSMTGDDQELNAALERIRYLQSQLAHLRRVETNPANYHLSESGARAVLAGRAVTDAARRLRAALGFLQLEPQAPELRLLHQWADTWSCVGAIVAGLHRTGGGSAWEPTPRRVGHDHQDHRVHPCKNVMRPPRTESTGKLTRESPSVPTHGRSAAVAVGASVVALGADQRLTVRQNVVRIRISGTSPVLRQLWPRLQEGAADLAPRIGLLHFFTVAGESVPPPRRAGVLSKLSLSPRTCAWVTDRTATSPPHTA